MKIELIEALVQALRSSSLSSLEYEADGVVVRLSFGHRDVRDGQMVKPAVTGSGGMPGPSGGPPPPRTIDARNTGRLLIHHPLSRTAAVSAGMSVNKGQMVAFLQVGDVLSAVRSPDDGVVMQQLVAEGTLVGFGHAIFRLA